MMVSAAHLILCALRIASGCRVGLNAEEYARSPGPRMAHHHLQKRDHSHLCTAFIFWHIESTGGRSILSLMTSYMKQKFLLCARTTLQRDYVKLLKNRTWVSANQHIFAEHHLHKFGGGWLSSYNKIRPAYTAFGCKLVIGTMLREPVSLFWSWFRHFGAHTKPFEEQARGKADMLLWSWGQGVNFSRPLVRKKVLRHARAAIATLDWLGLHSCWDESIVMLLDVLGLPLPPVRPHVGGAPPLMSAPSNDLPPPLVADFDCTWTNTCCMRYPDAPHCVITAREHGRAWRSPASLEASTAERTLISRLNAASTEYYLAAAENFKARLQSRRVADPSFATRVAAFRMLPVSHTMFGFQEVLSVRGSG